MMAVIMDYLAWRGDLTFDKSPFNEVDNYIVAKIGTADLTGIVPEDAREVPFGLALDLYDAKYGKKADYLGALASASIMPVMREAAKSVRFRDIRLSGFTRKYVVEETEQFSALTVVLPDGRRYVSFRGTDDTLIAWKENLLMSVEKNVAAQKDALAYLEWAAGAYPGELIVGGHSKGGNLAVYAAAAAAPEIQERICKVYSNDGPGFMSDFLRSEGYLRIRPKIKLILPQHSIVGTLLTQDDNYEIVRSLKAGFAGHDGFNWTVLGPAFERCGEFSKGSRVFDDSIDAMVEKMTVEDRRTFIEELFDTLEKSGAKTVTDITEQRLKNVLKLTNSLRKAPEVRKFIGALIEEMIRSRKELRKSGSE